MIVNHSIKELVGVTHKEFDDKLLEIIWEHKMIECTYILDENGIQLSDTIRLSDKNASEKSLIFYAARKGTDLSMEKYYYPLISARLKKYITEPYISLATGNLCITYSKIFTNVENRKYILCMDFKANENTYSLGLVNNLVKPNMFVNATGSSINDFSMIISQMNEIIINDSLTSIYNRRYIEERLPIDIFNTSRENQPISVIMADIDYFKKVNDTYGHLAGDLVLKEFTRIAKKNIRRNKGWIARYGGEEFLIVLLNANEEIAYKVAEKVRQAVEKAKVLYNETEIRVTASFGTCTLNCTKTTCDQLIDQADKNLYRAKNTGRNKTVSMPA